MLKLAGLLTLSLAAFAVQAQDTGIADETITAEPASADAAAPAESAADEAKKPFKPPPGFQTRKRGELVLYCKRDATLGTRFKTEKCYGIAKAGKNDCASTGNNSCGGSSKLNSDPKAWIYVPAGYCERIVGGSLQPK